MKNLLSFKEIIGSRFAYRTAAVAAACTLGFSAAACSSDDSGDAVDKETVTSTVKESVEASPSADGTDDMDDDRDDSNADRDDRDDRAGSARGGIQSGKHKSMSVDGKAVDTKLFSPVRCELGEDDGRKVLEVDFGGDDNGENDLDIEIYNDGPSLHSLDLEYKGSEYEIDDDHAGSATVKRQGDAYVVEGTPAEDDSNRTIALSVEFTCAN